METRLEGWVTYLSGDGDGRHAAHDHKKAESLAKVMHLDGS